MGAKMPNPAPNRRPDGSIDPAYRMPVASPAPPPSVADRRRRLNAALQGGNPLCRPAYRGYRLADLKATGPPSIRSAISREIASEDLGSPE